MRVAIIVEQIIDGESIWEHTELRGMIRLEQSGVNASGEKKWQIRAEREHHGDREEPCQKRKETCSEKIRAKIEKISVEQRIASIVVQNDA